MAQTETDNDTAVIEAEPPAAEAPAKPKRAPRKKAAAKEPDAEEAPSGATGSQPVESVDEAPAVAAETAPRGTCHRSRAARYQR